ncbi:Hsp70 family protein [Rhodococcus gannanensis]|uniref:Hsp70 family protein n=1 Tax=Rhodococcus gannanensis TaxID=1960308 RepID=A0ABW4PCU0_9NOCA
MATGLGLTVGSMQSTAALAADPTASAAGTAPGVQTHTVRTALALDGSSVSLLHEGEAPAVVVSGFAHRVGDPVALIADDGSSHTGADLVAATVRCLVDEAPPADAVAVAHPATWTGYQSDVLSAALERAGLADAVLLTEPQAAASWMRHAHPSADDSPVVVYDLGAGSLDVTVVRPAESPEVLGTPLRSEEYSGSAFDHMVLQHVLGALPDDARGIDPFEPETAAALTELRTLCRIAKEALSADTATVVGVDLPGVRSDVRLVREELEDLIREPLADSVNLVHEAVRSAGLELSDIGSVLLVGGSSAVPLVAELLSSQLRLPVFADVDPASTAAAGAALSAASAVATATADTDTAALTALGATIGAPAAPDATTTGIAATTGNGRRGAGLTTPKKAALISAAAAAIAVLAAGGLSLGTGAFGPASGSKSGAATTTSPATAGVAGPGTAAPTTAGAPGDAATTGSAGTPTGAANVPAGTRSGSSATTKAAAVAGTTGATPADPAAAQAGSAPTQAATVAPGPAPEAPVYTAPAPAPAPGGGGTGVGQGVGDAAAGAGEGLGNVVGGVGQGLGGVVGGVGQGLGGVVGGVGGVVGGILGQ